MRVTFRKTDQNQQSTKAEQKKSTKAELRSIKIDEGVTVSKSCFVGEQSKGVSC